MTNKNLPSSETERNYNQYNRQNSTNYYNFDWKKKKVYFVSAIKDYFK